MKRYLILLLILTGLSQGAFAQQDPMVSQYMFNGLLLNPAYAGYKPYIMTTLLHRSQWVGWDGAPRTQAFTVHGPTPNRINAFGLTLGNDHLGVTNRIDLYLNYAYHIPVGDRHTLSLGLKGGISHYKAELSKLTVWDNDDVFNGGTQTNLLPNFGTGALFFSDRFYAGISVPTLLSYDPTEVFSLGGNISNIPRVRRHYYAQAGYAAELNPNVVMRPSVLVKYVPGAPIEADLNLNFLLHNLFWVGGSFRTGDALVGILEFQATPKLRFGYAYDYTLTDVGNYSVGTHEFMISYDFGYDILKMKHPRYF